MPETELKITSDNNQLKLSGPLDLNNLDSANRQLKKIDAKTIDVSGITRLDTAGAMLLLDLSQNSEITGLKQEHQQLFELLKKAPEAPPEKKRHNSSFYNMINRLGRGSYKIKTDTIEFLTFFGQACAALGASIINPKKLRFGEIVSHIEQIGINAIPIVSLIAFLISIVLAYQGIAQLRPLGAEQFTVNLVAISVLREMGVLLTAIMVAGRSGSAFTAEIGVMQVREEVDALKAIGLDPFEILVTPRIIALIICMPLLTFIANLMGLLGGAVLSYFLIGITFHQYVDRVHHVATIGNAMFVGLVKAPIFAIAIGVVGCMHGMKVSGSSESVGRETTASVVKSIFLVLMLDALFSIFFQKIKI